MKKLFLICYVFASTTSAFAQVDSATAFETGKVIATTVANAAGKGQSPLFVFISTAAPLVFGWIWHATHLKKKIKSLQ